MKTETTFGRLLLPLIIGLILAFVNGTVLAEPYIAQRYNLQCSACHTNVTGGGKRNDTGVAYASALTDNHVENPLRARLVEAIAIGGNFRTDLNYTQFDDPDSNAQGVTGERLDDTSAFGISNGALYLDFALGERLALYLDQQVAPQGGRTREAFGLVRKVVDEQDYVKAGKFFLPYGLRLQDDNAFIREQTGFNFDNSDIGVEYGAERGPIAYAIAVTNGTQGAGENNTDKQVSSLISFVQPGYRLGASFAKNNAINGTSQTLYGVFGGLTLGNWVFLGELDRMRTDAAGVTTTALLGYLSLDYLLTTSTNVKLSYDYVDPNDDIDEEERTRISLLGETFLNQFSQLRYGLRRYDGIPQNTFQNQSQLFMEYHLFF